MGNSIEFTLDGQQTTSGLFELFDPSVVTDEANMLQIAVVMSLFTWRRAAADDALPASDGDRRGWWADLFEPDEESFGSRLWLLARSTLTAETVNRAREYAREALAWLVEDGIAGGLEVEAERQSGGRLALGVRLIREGADDVELRFDDLWEAIRHA